MAKQRVEAQVYPDRGGKFRWRIRARNRKIVAVSGESFSSKRNAQRAVTAFMWTVTMCSIDQAEAWNRAQEYRALADRLKRDEAEGRVIYPARKRPKDKRRSSRNPTETRNRMGQSR